MDIDKTISNLKLNGFVNAGQLVFTNGEIKELTHLCRNIFKDLSEQSKNGEMHKDFIDGSRGTEGFTRVPEHSHRISELLDKLVKDTNITKILNEALGPDYKIWQIVYRKASIGDKGLSLHQDAYGETNLSILLADNKKGFGSTIFLPSSHLFKKTMKQLKISTPTILLRWIWFLFSPLTGSKGDISLFFNHTWHGRAPNNSKDNYDVILFSFFPASGTFGFGGYGDWSDEFLRGKSTLAGLINPNIGTRLLEDGRYEILSTKDLKDNEPFVLKLHRGGIKSIKNKKFHLYFTVYLLRFIFLILKPFRNLKKSLSANKI